MIGIVKKIINYAKKERLNDPLRHCALYNNEGCCFCDSYLCSYPKCSLLETYLINLYKKRAKNG